MRRTVGIAVLALLLLASLCATPVVAKPPAKSAVSQFEVTIENPDGTAGSGMMIVNQKAAWYVFNGKKLTPGETYDLAVNGALLASGTAGPDGTLHLEGACAVKVETVTVTFMTMTLKESSVSWETYGYTYYPSDNVVAWIEITGYLRGPDGEPIPGATLDVYLEDRVTRLTDDSGNDVTLTTDADGLFEEYYCTVSHYGWIWYPAPSKVVTQRVAIKFAGNDHYSEAWSSPVM